MGIMFEVKNKDGSVIKIEPQMLFTLFLKDVNENKPELLNEVEKLEKHFFNLFDESALFNSPLIKIMNLFFILGYQYSKFKDKNEARLNDSDSTETGTESI